MDKREDCICLSLRRVTQAITQYYDKVLTPSGLKITQYSLLNRIRQRETASVGELAKSAGLDRTTMGKNLQLLADSGLITLTSGIDKRERVARITEQGREALEMAIPLWQQAQEEMTTVLGQERIGTFHKLLADLEAATI